MPGRRKKIFTDGVYHVFNKTIESSLIFENEYNAHLFLHILEYYRSSKARIGLSTLERLPQTLQEGILQDVMDEKYFKIKILAYCLMPTHYHLLLRQTMDGGVSKFISDSINSFTRHINIKKGRKGPIFLTKFKAVPILSDEQLIHVSRYIHLNPYSNQIVNTTAELKNYPWSSYNQYMTNSRGICDIKPILKLFGSDSFRYERFVTENADYQKTLELVKHAEKWI